MSRLANFSGTKGLGAELFHSASGDVGMRVHERVPGGAAPGGSQKPSAERRSPAGDTAEQARSSVLGQDSSCKPGSKFLIRGIYRDYLAIV